MATPHYRIDTPVQLLECERAWNALTIQEKLYAYHFSLASWEGSKICYFQRSYESPGIFLLLQELFAISYLKERALQAGLTEEDFLYIKAYASGVYVNCGNYLSYGNSKFTPEIAREKMETLIREVGTPRIKKIWAKIGDIVYDMSPSRTTLDFPDRGGVSSYYSYNVTSTEAELVKRFLQSTNQIHLHWNSRLWKVNDVLEVRIPSGRDQWLPYLGEYNFEDRRIRIVNGDFHIFTKRIVSHLANVLPYCANPTQERMVLSYIKHFATGDVNEHKNSQREWIRDVGPVIETNIGFIENYADPLMIRSEFEGIVSVVDKIVSAKYTTLVERAEEIITKLPWGKTFEKDTFLKPDFTSLTVLTFASGMLPVGINIPNYDDIRQSEGFKNVSLGNAFPRVTIKNLQFLTLEDSALISEMFDIGWTLQVALHELLGHGSGKLLIKDANGEFNFDTSTINPATGQVIDSWYEADDTWSSKFADISNPYEECRAETVGIYLSCFQEPYDAFGVTNVEKTRNMMWLHMAYSGVKGLQLYNPDLKKWGQAHAWGRYVILRVMLEVEDFITFEFTEDGLFVLRMDYSKILTSGFKAISDFLIKLMCFKSTGDVTRGRELFNHYSQIDEIAQRLREIVVANQKPRKCDVQCHLNFQGELPVLVKFDESFDGIIQSFQQRFPEFDEEMLEFWEEEFNFNHH